MWYVVCGMWYVVWCMEYCIWCKVFGVWCLVLGVWCMHQHQCFWVCRHRALLQALYHILLVASCSWLLSDNSGSVFSHSVTCVDTVTVHLRSQCSGACSDVQETAEVQSWAERWWVVQLPSAVPVPLVKQGCCLPPCRKRGQCQSMSRRGGATNKGGGGGGGEREDAG